MLSLRRPARHRQNVLDVLQVGDERLQIADCVEKVAVEVVALI
jgi:hypothetical protein